MPRALVRAVVDTNILVRGILRRRESVAVRVFDALVRGDFRPLVSDYILGEVSKTLREPDVRVLRRSLSRWSRPATSFFTSAHTEQLAQYRPPQGTIDEHVSLTG